MRHLVLLLSFVLQGPNFTAADQLIDVYLSRFADFQVGYQSANGQPFQALWSHDFLPEPGDELPNRLTDRPSDRPHDFSHMWDVVRVGQGRLPFRFRVDSYSAPCGVGYVIVFEGRFSGNSYRRSINSGCETYREHYWLRHEQVQP